MMGGFGMGVFGIGMLMMVLFWVLIIGGAIWLIATLARGSTVTSGSNLPATQNALDVLKTRYARGEITKEQFDQMRRDLGV